MKTLSTYVVFLIIASKFGYMICQAFFKVKNDNLELLIELAYLLVAVYIIYDNKYLRKENIKLKNEEK
ncbi:MAG: hypothetical protein CFE24_02315 [Flavobacterium sp. BFFFF2]|nr:MAG: hypothetical protein CFE24_02315 [Flavobacterium sp. BFFFF2]